MISRYNFSDLINFSFLTKISTGNMLVDTIISTFFITMISYLKEYVPIIQDYVKELYSFYYYHKKCKIELQGKITMNKYGEMNYNFSNNIRSILYFINQKTSKINVYSLKEIVTNINKIWDLDGINRNMDIESNFIINQRKPVLLFKDIYCTIELEKDISSINNDKSNVEQMTLSVILFTNKNINIITEFLKIISKEYEDHKSENILSKQYYFGLSQIDTENRKISYSQYIFSSNTSFNNLFFDGKKIVKDNLDFFLNNKEYYEKKGLPYRLGLLLYGEPGCGKTSLIKAIANYTNRHIINVNFKSIKSKEDLENIFYSNTVNNYNLNIDKKIFVIEEFDVNGIDTLRDRKISYDENVKVNNDLEKFLDKNSSFNPKNIVNEINKEENTLTLGNVLEILDGVIENSGRILIITTNDFKKLDPALIRPGRIDRTIEFKKCSTKIIKEIIFNFFQDKNYSKDTINLFSSEIDKKRDIDLKYSPAEIINQCCLNRNNLKTLIKNL